MALNIEQFSVVSNTPHEETHSSSTLGLSEHAPVESLDASVKAARRGKLLPKHIIVLKDKLLKYKCTICATSFKSRSNCCYHKHCGDYSEKPFICSICGGRFSTKTHFSYHILTHSGVSPFKCQECDKSFKTKSKLRRHQDVHTELQKRFSCDVCGRSFLRKSSIRIHKRTHTGEKPYRCDKCPKSFREKKNLIFHLSHHTGIKNWICEVCGKSYSIKWDLELHKRTHSRLRPFCCTVSKCPRTFSQKRYLKRHMETHESLQKFICNICEKEFSRKDNLQRHVLNTHLETDDQSQSKAEKTNPLLDTAPYIKTIQLNHETDETHERVLTCERTESVIKSVTRTQGVVSYCSQRVGDNCGRVSVIRTVGDVLSTEKTFDKTDSCTRRGYQLEVGSCDLDDTLTDECVVRSETSSTNTNRESRKSITCARENGNFSKKEITNVECSHLPWSEVDENSRENSDRNVVDAYEPQLCERQESNMRAGEDCIFSDSKMIDVEYAYVSESRIYENLYETCEQNVGTIYEPLTPELHQSVEDESADVLSVMISDFDDSSAVSHHITDYEQRESTHFLLRNQKEKSDEDAVLLQIFESANQQSADDVQHSSQKTAVASHVQYLDAHCDRGFLGNADPWKVPNDEVIYSKYLEPDKRGWISNTDPLTSISFICDIGRSSSSKKEVHEDCDRSDRWPSHQTNRIHAWYGYDIQTQEENCHDRSFEISHDEEQNCRSSDRPNYHTAKEYEHPDSRMNTMDSFLFNGWLRGCKPTDNVSHFVPNFMPEKRTEESMKTRCMLPKKVIAATYKDLSSVVSENTSTNVLRVAAKDGSNRLLDLSMKS